MTDFKPTHILAKIVISLAVTITSYIKIHIMDTSEFKHSYYKPSSNKSSGSISFKFTHTLTQSLSTVPADDHLQQKHWIRRRERPLPIVLSITHRRIEAVDTVAVIHLPICNKWEQSPEYEKVLS
jgi:hypothetical protein